MAVEQLRLELELMAFGQLALERWELALELVDRKSTRLNSSHITRSRMPSSA